MGAKRGNLGTDFDRSFAHNGLGGDAEAVEAPACKAGLSGFESHRHLQILLVQTEDIGNRMYRLHR